MASLPNTRPRAAGSTSSSLILVEFLQSSCFGEQSHIVTEILQGHDSYQPLLIDDGDHRQAAGSDLAESNRERFAFLADVYHAVHHRLNVAVPFRPNGIDNLLSRDCSHEIAAANYQEIVLQGMDSFFQGVLQSVGGGEYGEVG